jgi:lysophospholipase L1-like esterase
MRNTVPVVRALGTLLSILVAAGAGAQMPPPPQAQAPSAPPITASCSELAQALNAVVRNDSRLRDWANLTRYRDANLALVKSAAGEARVVFMGDSITDPWQQPRFGGFFPGRPYVDRGISGQTTPQMLVRFRPDVIDLGARAVVILAGTNDIAGNTGPMTDGQIEGNLASMCDLAGAHGIKVILAVGEYHVAAAGVPQTTQRPMARIRAINGWIKQYATANGHVYLDYFAATVDETGLLKADLSDDDLHPNAKGYAVMAPLAEAAIAQSLARR